MTARGAGRGSRLRRVSAPPPGPTMTARPENRSRSLSRLRRLGPARSRGCSPRTPMHPRYRPSARQCAAPLGSPVPLGPNSASLHTAPRALNPVSV